MTNDLEVIDTSVDTQFFVDGHRFTSNDVLSGVDTLLNQVRETGEFEPVADAIRSMSAIAQVTGWAAAKALHGASKIWAEQGHDPDRFSTYFRDNTHLSSLVIERYIRAWEAVTQLPQISEQLIAQPIKNGIALGALVEQGYEPTDKQIEKLSDASSNQEFLNIVREIKGKPAKKNSLTIFLESDGSLQAWQGGKHAFVGDLDITSDDSMVQKAVNRIVENSGIMRRK